MTLECVASRLIAALKAKTSSGKALTPTSLPGVESHPGFSEISKTLTRGEIPAHPPTGRDLVRLCVKHALKNRIQKNPFIKLYLATHL